MSLSRAIFVVPGLVCAFGLCVSGDRLSPVGSVAASAEQADGPSWLRLPDVTPRYRDSALLDAPGERIVVLGGGRRVDEAEYGGDTLNAFSLERLRYAAFLHRASGLPILVSGGKPNDGTLAEGRIMQHILQTEYGISPRWIEDASLTTWDNARQSAPLLKQDGVYRIALVSHAWHLRRAVPLFEAQGLSVIPAGIQFSSIHIDSVFDLLPTPAGLRDSTYALHEWLGILWYKLRTSFA